MLLDDMIRRLEEKLLPADIDYDAVSGLRLEAREKLKKIIDDMECLLFEERRNAEESIIYVSKDSRLGWEPTMGYVGDEWHIRWKIRQVNRVLETDLRNWRIAADT